MVISPLNDCILGSSRQAADVRSKCFSPGCLQYYKYNYAKTNEKGRVAKVRLKPNNAPLRRLLAGSFFKGFDAIGKQFAAGGAIAMVGFGVDVCSGALVNMR